MVVIYKEDNELTRRRKRELNKQQMREEHEKGAIYMYKGIPKDCLVEQPGGDKRTVVKPMLTTAIEAAAKTQRLIKEAKKRVSRQTTW